jgi:AraC family transcriptional regulator
MTPRLEFLRSLRDLTLCLDGDLSLASLASRSKRSRFQFHREFARSMGETPKRYTLRIRLERAASRLIATNDSILSISLEHGFASHEVFTRAFRRMFGRSPARYRADVMRLPLADRLRHARFIAAIGPCTRLFGVENQNESKGRTVVTTSAIERREITAQPILYIRRRVPRTQLKDMFAECFGKLFMYGHQAGLAIAGWPLARYVSMGPGLWTVDAAMPLASPAPSNGEMQAGELYGGPVAFAVHSGPYELLPETNAAIERWVEANGYEVAGAPWESYVTDPAQHPDPKDWKTEVYWPLK